MKKVFFLSLIIVGLISFSSCTSRSARKFKEKEKIAKTPNTATNKISPEVKMLQELSDQGMVGVAITGGLTFLDKKSVEDGYIISFVIWVNNDGGLFLTLNEVPSVEAIKHLKKVFHTNQFDEYLKINRGAGILQFQALLGSVSKDKIFDEVEASLRKLETIADTRYVEAWKDYKFEKPKGKSTIIMPN